MFDIEALFLQLLPGIFLAIPWLGALVLGFSVPVVALLVASFTRNWSSSTRLLVIVGSLVLGSALSLIFSGRTIFPEAQINSNPLLAAAMNSESSAGSVRVNQVSTLLALIFSASEIFRWFSGSARLIGHARAIWLSLLFYFATSILLSGLVADRIAFQLRDLYFPIVGTAIILLSSNIDGRFWLGLRWLLLIPTGGSLIALAVSPSFAALTGYRSLVPGMSIRLYGLAEHANAIGMVAAAALLVEVALGRCKSLGSVVAVLIHSAVVILSQSKTVWLALPLLLASGIFIESRRRLVVSKRWSADVLASIFVLISVCTLLVGVYAFLSGRFGSRLASIGVFSLTGRDEIWDVTITEFLRNPWTGYGPSLWGPEFRFQHGLLAAGQAHNQFIQTLGQSGVIGSTCLIVYILVLASAIYAKKSSRQVLGLMLGGLVLIRCITEAPLRMAGVTGWENILHILLLVIAVSVSSAAGSGRVGRLSGSPANVA